MRFLDRLVGRQLPRTSGKHPVGATYELLGAVDEAFFWLEQKTAPMHLASTLIFDAGDLQRPDGGVNADAIRNLIAAKLHRVPRYRRKIAWIPLAQRPVWVDDPDFNLDYHVRHTSLPRPGSDAQLKQLCASFMAETLDRDRPLWQVHIIEGLPGGRFAAFGKVHHSMVDGVSGIDLLNVLLSPLPGTQIREPKPYTPRPIPGAFELWCDEMRRLATRPMIAARQLRALAASTSGTPSSILSRLEALGALVGGMFRRPSPTPFNRSLSARRRMEWLTMSLEPIEAIRHALGGSVNDVALAIVTGAARRYFIRKHVPVDGMDFRAMTPVSTRGDDQDSTVGNRVSAWVVDLPISEPNPRTQLERIHHTTRALKESEVPIGASVVTEMSELTRSALLISLTARHVTRLLPCNLIVTNIPGPAMPVYLQGATLTDAFPFGPLTDGLGLSVGVMSYNGKLCWGFNADGVIVPDLDVFVRDIGDAFDDLRRAASKGRKRRAPLRASTIGD